MGGPQPRLKVEVREGLLTLNAEGVPLADVLRATEVVGSFRVVLHGNLTAPITAAFSGEPIWRALAQLTRGHLLVAFPTSAGPGPNGWEPREVRVYESTRWSARPEGGASTARRVGPASRAFTSRLVSEFARAHSTDQVTIIAKLSLLPPSVGVAVLAGALAEPNIDRRVRSRAVAALTRIEDLGACALLRERALSDRDESIRRQAMNALAAVTCAQAIPTLGRVLRLERMPQVKVEALGILARIGGAPVRTHIEYAAADADSYVRNAAKRALAGLSSAL